MSARGFAVTVVERLRRRIADWLAIREPVRRIVRTEVAEALRRNQPTGWKATESDPWWQRQRARREAERAAMWASPKALLLQRLHVLATEADQPDQAVAGADQALLLYIADDEVREAYEAVPRPRVGSTR